MTQAVALVHQRNKAESHRKVWSRQSGSTVESSMGRPDRGMEVGAPRPGEW
jgi:hypothetical protein